MQKPNFRLWIYRIDKIFSILVNCIKPSFITNEKIENRRRFAALTTLLFILLHAHFICNSTSLTWNWIALATICTLSIDGWIHIARGIHGRNPNHSTLIKAIRKSAHKSRLLLRTNIDCSANTFECTLIPIKHDWNDFDFLL